MTRTKKRLIFGLLIMAILFGAGQVLIRKMKTDPVPDAYDQGEDGENRAKSAASQIIGMAGPALTLNTINGQVIDLSGLYGKRPIYLKFWATWCVPCRAQMPHFEELYHRYGKDMKILAVNTGFNDSNEAVLRYLKEVTMSMPIVVDDGTLTSIFKVQVTPMHLIIGRDGQIAYSGHKDGPELQMAIEAAIGQPRSDQEGTNPPLEEGKQFAVGDSVQDLQLVTLEGEKVSFSPPPQKSTALVFLAPWCESYLSESRPEMASACERSRKQVDALLGGTSMAWFGISTNLWVKREDIVDYKKTTGTNLKMVYDGNGELFHSFGIRQVPTVVVVNSSGKVARILGPDTSNLEAAITQ